MHRLPFILLCGALCACEAELHSEAAADVCVVCPADAEPVGRGSKADQGTSPMGRPGDPPRGDPMRPGLGDAGQPDAQSVLDAAPQPDSMEDLPDCCEDAEAPAEDGGDSVDGPGPDAGLLDPDAQPDRDAGASEPDMAAPEPDMAAPEPDMAAPEPDMAAPEPDMFVPPEPPNPDLPAWIRVGHGLQKYRPDTPLPEGLFAALDAAKNEFEVYQVVLRGGNGGRSVRSVEHSALTGPEGYRIEGNEIVVYKPGMFNVPSAANIDGAPGLWPDPMIPDVDPWFGERRNAFPMEVPANQVRAIWVDVHVPADAPAGNYEGHLDLQTSSGAWRVPVQLRVRRFGLPSTSTLKSAYNHGWDAACRAHHGGYEQCGQDRGVEHYHILYGKAALDHRISLEAIIYPGGPPWAHFDEVYSEVFEGVADIRLVGARQTTARSLARDQNQANSWRAHFDDQGWGATLFGYTCDEPPNGCPWNSIGERARISRTAGIASLVTTSISHARQHNVLQHIDILVPILQELHQRGGGSSRAGFDGWLNEDASREIWTYISCQSHGCGVGCDTSPLDIHAGWPSYNIDSHAIQNRALEWLSFKHRVSGELYYETTLMLATAWEDQCAFSGAGDGTLFYAGTPARIGGETDIPIVSMRMKLIREGMEDFEYLHLLRSMGDEAWAQARVAELFPQRQTLLQTPPERLYEIRAQIADRIEELL